GERITQIKNFLDIKRVKNDATPRPLRILAVSRPGEKGLRPAVWTASMVRYVVGSVQLVIAGRMTPEQQQRIAAWEKMWDSEGLCCLTKEAFGWEELMTICDMVLASGPRLEGLIRLVYAQAAGKHIIALRSECMELLVPNDHVHFVDRPCARELSRAVLGVIREDLLAAMSEVTT
ncbi:MAG: hypothetical protein JW709_07690, partial [Sedimentisphaerales bacterium]|nr:hypothetical protein [Sedimentisphaerales bacterium]